jgi:hypothetical protein
VIGLRACRLPEAAAPDIIKLIRAGIVRTIHKAHYSGCGEQS